MSRVLRSVRKRKKGRTLGAVDVIDREGYAELEVDAKVELIRSLIPLGLLHIEEWLDEEVPALAGERYARKDPSVGGRRHGSHPGTVGLAGQRVPIRVPRIRHVTEREIPLRSYEALHGDRAVNDLLLRRVLYGISCRNYAAAAEAIPGAIGLSGSTVSRAFIQASATKLRELQERDLSGEDVVALVLDGKTFAEATMVVALGITMTGDKRVLGFVETDTENEQVLTPFLRSLVERGLDVSQGLLVIVDGGKGLRASVRKAFRHRALVQRCQWHKRENVVSYLAKREQPVWRQRLQRAYNRPEYDEALAALQSLQHELEDRNQSAAGSLAEGLDETLTLHRGVVARIVTGQHDAHRQDPHLPMRYDTGRPRAVIRLRISQLVRRPGRWDDDRRTPRPRRFVDGDRVIGGVSGDAHERALDRGEQIEGGSRIIPRRLGQRVDEDHA